jgi:hypothetical protein
MHLHVLSEKQAFSGAVACSVSGKSISTIEPEKYFVTRRPSLLRGEGFEFKNIEITSGEPIRVNSKDLMKVNKDDDITISLG